LRPGLLRAEGLQAHQLSQRGLQLIGNRLDRGLSGPSVEGNPTTLPNHQVKISYESHNDGLMLRPDNSANMNWIVGLKRARRFPKPEEVFGT